MTYEHNIMGMVRLREIGGTRTGQLTVPAAMMRFLTAGALYKPEFTDEGILYKFVGDATLAPPDWAKT